MKDLDEPLFDLLVKALEEKKNICIVGEPMVGKYELMEDLLYEFSSLHNKKAVIDTTDPSAVSNEDLFSLETTSSKGFNLKNLKKISPDIIGLDEIRVPDDWEQLQAILKEGTQIVFTVVCSGGYSMLFEKIKSNTEKDILSEVSVILEIKKGTKGNIYNLIET